MVQLTRSHTSDRSAVSILPADAGRKTGLPMADYCKMLECLEVCRIDTSRHSVLLGYILSNKLTNTVPVLGVHESDLVVSGTCVTYAVDRDASQVAVLTHEPETDLAPGVISLKSLLGATLIGMRVGQGAALLRPDGTVGRVFVVATTMSSHQSIAIPSLDNPRSPAVSVIEKPSRKPSGRRPKVVIDADALPHLEKLGDRMMKRHPEISDRLLDELNRARIVPTSKMPADVVGMDSVVTYRDETTGQEKTVTLVYPEAADIAQNRVSVMTPIGVALLGLAEGASFFWDTRGNERRTLTILLVERQQKET